MPQTQSWQNFGAWFRGRAMKAAGPASRHRLAILLLLGQTDRLRHVHVKVSRAVRLEVRAFCGSAAAATAATFFVLLLLLLLLLLLERGDQGVDHPALQRAELGRCVLGAQVAPDHPLEPDPFQHRAFVCACCITW